MEIIDTIKEVIKVAQKADNVEIIQQLLTVQAEALELQQKNIELQNKINELERDKEIEAKIIRHQDPYMTLKDDPQNLPYCATCWSTKHQLIQLQYNGGRGQLNCPACKYWFYSDYEAELNHDRKVQRISY